MVEPKGKIGHWYDEDGPLTDEDIAALEAAADEMGKGNWNKPVLIRNEQGVYVAPAGAQPGEEEEYF